MNLGLGLGLGVKQAGGGGSPPTPFSPTDISDLALWLDASDTSTITEVSGSVSQWDDKSGNANHATQSTAGNQPTTGTRTVNLLNVIDFDGTNDFFDFACSQINDSDFTAFAVGQIDAFSANNWFIGADTVSASAGSRLHLGFGSSTNLRMGFWGNDVNGTVPAVSTGTTVCPVGRMNSLARNIYLNGGSSVANNTASSNLVNYAGRLGFLVSNFTDGVLCEIVIYHKALSVSEMNDVGNYLADKWNFTWTDIT